MPSRSRSDISVGEDTDRAGRIFRRAASLAFPRYPGTTGDRRVIAMVADHLSSCGLEVSIESFSYDLSTVWRILRGLLVSAAVLILLGGLLVETSPWVSIVLVALAVLGGSSLLGWSPWLERLYAGDGPTETANVVARRPHSEESTPPSLTLIVLAHHDSKSQNLTMLQRGALTIGALGGASVVLGLALTVALGGPGGTSLRGGLAGGAAALCLVVLSTLRSGNESPGGVDNAGSLSILLELASTLPSAVPPEVELIFLSPGAEEDHMVGAMRWLDRHREAFEDRRVLALNFDGSGAPGRLVLLERYGIGQRLSPTLSTLAREVARDQGQRVRGVLMPPAMGIDAIPFVHRGIECLTLSSGSLDRATLSVHSRGDRAEHLSPPVLDATFRLASEMLGRLAARALQVEPDGSA